MDRRRSFATRAALAGRTEEPRTVSRPLLQPIYQTTVYAFDSMEDLDRMRAGSPGNIYYRNGSPNHQALEAVIASLEGAESAIAAASGMAIISSAILAVASAGEHIVADRYSYGVTYTLLTQELPRFGIEVTLVDAADLAAVDRAITPRTRAVLIEALTNPTMRVADIPALCELGRARNVPVIVDATFASPALMRPIEHGAALSWHSVAKYIGGHSAAVGGIAAGDAALVSRIRRIIERFGGTQGVMDVWLTMLGIPTLPLRMQAHSATATAVAAFLAAHPSIDAVHYPTIASHPHHALAQRLYPLGCGGMLSFEVRGGEAAARHVLAALQDIPFAPSLADVATTISYPYATSHYTLSAEERSQVGVGPGLLRLSVGIESSEDVIADLAQALQGV